MSLGPEGAGLCTTLLPTRMALAWGASGFALSSSFVPTVHLVETAEPLGSALLSFSGLINHLLARVMSGAGAQTSICAPSKGHEVEKETGTLALCALSQFPRGMVGIR